MLTPSSGIESDNASVIIHAAKLEFFEKGYGNTSICDIVRRSGLSAQSVQYTLRSKHELFLEVMEDQLSRYKQKMNLLLIPEDTLRGNLHRVAESYISFITSAGALRLLRICLAEQSLFPEFAAEFYESGPKQGMMILERVLRNESDHEGLAIENTYEAANNFFSLCRGELFVQRLLFPELTVDEERISSESQRELLSNLVYDHQAASLSD